MDSTPGYKLFVEEAAADMQFVDNLIAFTWSPEPGRYPSTQPSKQYNALLGILYKYTTMFSTFVFTPEVSKQGNIHIHGMYTVKDSVKYFKSFLPTLRTYGFVKVTSVGDIDGWIEYICKNIDDMNLILDDHLPIPLTHVNVGCYKRLWTQMNKSRKLRLRMSTKGYALFHKMDIKQLFAKKIKVK